MDGCCGLVVFRFGCLPNPRNMGWYWCIAASQYITIVLHPVFDSSPQASQTDGQITTAAISQKANDRKSDLRRHWRQHKHKHRQEREDEGAAARSK